MVLGPRSRTPAWRASFTRFFSRVTPSAPVSPKPEVIRRTFRIPFCSNWGIRPVTRRAGTVTTARSIPSGKSATTGIDLPPRNFPAPWIHQEDFTVESTAYGVDVQHVTPLAELGGCADKGDAAGNKTAGGYGPVQPVRQYPHEPAAHGR